MAATEKAVKARIKEIIAVYSNYNNIYTLCPMTFGYGESGHPDRLLLVNGNFLGIEAKRDRNNHHDRPELKPKTNEVTQARQAQKIRDAGGTWVCINKSTLSKLIQTLDSLCKVGSDSFSPMDYERLQSLVEELH